MRKYTAILLGACLFLPFAGTWGYFQLERNKHRQEMINRVTANGDPGELVALSFSREETLTRLNWEHDREFEFEGQMYDIVRVEERGDTVVYHCFADHKESRLNREIRKVFSGSSGQDPARKTQSERFSQFLKSMIHPHALTRPPDIQSSDKRHHPVIFCHYISLCCSPPAPPPKSV